MLPLVIYPAVDIVNGHVSRYRSYLVLKDVMASMERCQYILCPLHAVPMRLSKKGCLIKNLKQRAIFRYCFFLSSVDIRFDSFQDIKHFRTLQLVCHALTECRCISPSVHLRVAGLRDQLYKYFQVTQIIGYLMGQKLYYPLITSFIVAVLMQVVCSGSCVFFFEESGYRSEEVWKVLRAIFRKVVASVSYGVVPRSKMKATCTAAVVVVSHTRAGF